MTATAWLWVASAWLVALTLWTWHHSTAVLVYGRTLLDYSERLDRLESSLASGPDAARYDAQAEAGNLTFAAIEEIRDRIEALEIDPCRGVKALDVATLTNRVTKLEETSDTYATREQAESLARSVEAFADKLDEHLVHEREHADALVAAHRRRWPAPDPGEAS